jgi:hypothetical protein
MKRIAALALAGIVAFGLNSCILNPEEDKPVDKPPPQYKCLDTTCPQDNVLINLQSAYNGRNSERYEELLDADFLFYFSAEDVLNGAVEYWGRVEELRATKNLFDPNYSHPVRQPAQDIDLSLAYPEGDDQWTQITPEDQVKYAGETWYQKIVTYNLTVQISSEFQYVGLNKQAAFVLREALADTQKYWKIVVWRDDTGT